MEVVPERRQPPEAAELPQEVDLLKVGKDKGQMDKEGKDIPPDQNQEA